MGIINIEIAGSFRPDRPAKVTSFSAMDHGHADAVARAIEYLSSEVLPAAIRRDHFLHEQGDKPNGPFGRDVWCE